MTYQLVFDAATQPILDRVFIGTYLLLTVVSIFCLFVLNRKYTQINVVFFSVWIVGGVVFFFSSCHHRSECRRWAQSGDYQIAEGAVENFVQTRHSSGRGSKYTIEDFTVQGVAFQNKAGIDVFNGGFHETESVIKQGIWVKIAHKDHQILKLWVASGY